MDTDDRQGPANNHRGGWYLVKGIPIATIVAFFITITPQTVAFVFYLSSLTQKIDHSSYVLQLQGDKLVAVEKKVDDLKDTLQGGAVPSAINGRRIDEIEKLVGQLAASVAMMQAKVIDNDRRITTLERGAKK